MLSVDVHIMRDSSWLKDSLWCSEEHMRSVAHVLRTRHGSGALTVASRKTGTVNLVVSRKSGGAVRTPGNAGDKRVKRKRGGKSAAAVAARIERGYLAIQQLNARLQQQETAVTILAQERETLSQKVQSMTGTPRQRVRAGVVDTRVIGKPDQSDGDLMKYADWSLKLRSYLRAVDQRYQQELTTAETSSTARLNATFGSEESALSTQVYLFW